MVECKDSYTPEEVADIGNSIKEFYDFYRVIGFRSRKSPELMRHYENVPENVRELTNMDGLVENLDGLDSDH